MQRFYFHEAFIINEDESLFKNGRPNRSLPVNDSSSSVYSISRRLIASNENVRAKRSSRNIDSEDRELTTGQQKYFASSKLRDADGKLKVMYHGSTNAGFTTFDPQYSDDGISLFFTDSPRVAESYSGSDEEWRPDKHYSFDELSGMVDGYFAGDLQLIQNGDKTGLITVDGDVLYEGDLNGARDAFFDEIAEVPYDRGAANYKVYLNLENPYEFDANGRDWDELTEPRYASDVQHEYERLNVSHDAATDRYSLIGTDVSGNKETVFENKTLSEIEEEYGENLREFMADTYYYKRSGTSVETSTYSDVGFDGEWSLMNSHLTTREIADYAKKNGYDGVIFKNIVDMGTYRRGHEASTVAIAFSSDQVKSVDNENPTTYADFRRAIGIDDTWNDDYDWTAEESKIQSGLAEALRSGNEILKGAEVNEANIRRIARQLKNQYGSRISVDELAENLTKVFAYAQKQDYINYNDLATVISEVASPMIEQSTAKTSAQEFKAFKQALQSYTFRLDESQQKEVISAFGSWGPSARHCPALSLRATALAYLLTVYGTPSAKKAVMFWSRELHHPMSLWPSWMPTTP